MDYRTLFKGNYITAIEFGERVPTFTITAVSTAMLEDEKGALKSKVVVSFDRNETDRGWVICKTNAMCVAAMFGNDTDDWIGKRVTLFATEVSVGKEMKPGIRVVGSPDITKPIGVSIKLPRKKAFVMTMQPQKRAEKMAQSEATRPSQQPKPREPEPHETATEEVGQTKQSTVSAPVNGGGGDRAALMDRMREWG